MKKLLIYTISNEYVNWLSSHEPNIMWAKAHKLFSRPYIGIVLEISDYFYFAPLTHKANKWIGYQDHFVMKRYGTICFNNMIPIAKQCRFDLTSVIDFKDLLKKNIYSKNYCFVLINEHNFINMKSNKIKIYKIAKQVYYSWNKLKNKANYCCDFKKIEKYAFKWSEFYQYNFLINLIKKSLNTLY